MDKQLDIIMHIGEIISIFRKENVVFQDELIEKVDKALLEILESLKKAPTVNPDNPDPLHYVVRRTRQHEK